jgi:hypothetical protein
VRIARERAITAHLRGISVSDYQAVNLVWFKPALRIEDHRPLTEAARLVSAGVN